MPSEPVYTILFGLFPGSQLPIAASWLKSSRKTVDQIELPELDPEEEPDAGTAEEEGVGTGVGAWVAFEPDPEVELDAELVGVGLAVGDEESLGDGVAVGEADWPPTPTAEPECIVSLVELLAEALDEVTAADTGVVVDCGATVVQIQTATMTQPPCLRILRSTGTR